jgi:hypothetical protein
MLKSLLERGLDNLRFALDLDGYVPEHIIGELRSSQESTNGDEDPGDMAEFSSDVEQIFSKSRPKSKSSLKPANGNHQRQVSFDEIIGYDDLKELLMKCLVVKDSCNVLLSSCTLLYSLYSLRLRDSFLKYKYLLYC